MRSTTLHWASQYVGKPWRKHARGPQEYDCWGLVQQLARRRLGVAMPDMQVGQQLNREAIFEAVRDIGWRKLEVGEVPRADDVLLMRNRAGDRHCGYMVQDGTKLRVLHADGHQTPSGPVGAVVSQTIEQAIAGGYREHEFWRHVP